MSVRRLIIEIDLRTVNVAEFCRLHGVSTWFFYDLRRRFAVEGEAVLEPGSRAARRVANRTPDWIEDLIVELRKSLDDAGLDAGPGTIHTHLKARIGDGVTPSESTIWRILTRRGFVTPEPQKAPKAALRRFAAERANECWQVDDFEWALADGSVVHVIGLIDDCTRLCPGLKACVAVNGDTVFQVFSTAAEEWGWPERFLSDNHPVYRQSLADAVATLGVDHRHGRPYHPQTQGKIERFHLTAKKWLQKQSPARTVEELQTRLEQFRRIYNHERPHRAIGRKTPASVYETTPKTGPSERAIGTPTSIHQVNIDRNGNAYISKKYTIPLGNKHAGQQATIITTGPDCHIFIGGHLIRALQLDPTRRYQPLYDQPGRPMRDAPRHP